jgi:hypothetical protein
MINRIHNVLSNAPALFEFGFGTPSSVGALGERVTFKAASEAIVMARSRGVDEITRL